MLYTNTDPSLISLLNECREERGKSRTVTPLRAKPEVMMAIVHGINYIKLIIERKEDYILEDGLDSPEKWFEVYQRIATDPAYRELYKRILLERDIVTTYPVRAIGPHAVTRLVYGDEPVNIGEMGSGPGHLLIRMSTPEAADYDPYNSVDETAYDGEEGIIQKAAQRPINLVFGVGIEKNPIKTKSDLDWYMACGHPKNMNPVDLRKKRARLDHYEEINKTHHRKVVSMQQDMRFPIAGEDWCDVVYAATSAYLIPRGQRTEMFEKWQQLLTDNGLMIVEDNCRIGENGELDFGDYGDHPYALIVRGKTTGNKWLEVARFSDSLCSEITNGRDMDEFMVMARSFQTARNGSH